MFSLNGTLKKVGRSGDGKRNNLLGWPNAPNMTPEIFPAEVDLDICCEHQAKRN